MLLTANEPENITIKTKVVPQRKKLFSSETGRLFSLVFTFILGWGATEVTFKHIRSALYPEPPDRSWTLYMDIQKQSPRTLERIILEQDRLHRRQLLMNNHHPIFPYTPTQKYFSDRTLHHELSALTSLQHRNARNVPRGWPVQGMITSDFGMRESPFLSKWKFHHGIDIANALGTPVRATADGTVRYAQDLLNFGKLVIIDHGYGYLTYYGHNSHVTVQTGDRIRRGQLIAYMGSSGQSTGNHLHYEIWYMGQSMDPLAYLNDFPAQKWVVSKKSLRKNNL